METKKEQTAVEFAVEKLEKFIPSGNQIAIGCILEQAKEMEKEQKIKMLNTFLCNAQMGEDVEDVEAWFKQYENKSNEEG
jgi:predicted nucleic-acid-binding protein